MAKSSGASQTDEVYRFFVRFLSSDRFFYAVVALMVIQALWYAFSFQPTIFDEGQHLNFIFLYSHHWSPFIHHQSKQWDIVGEATREPSYLFYYLMSWILRFVRLFTASRMAQIISLRLVCTALIVLGLFLYRKLFLELKFSRSLVHLVLLFLVLTPTVALYPGTVHYDDAIFPLYALLLLFCVNVLRENSVSFKNFALILMICFFGSIIYFPFIVLFTPVILYVAYEIWAKNPKKRKLLATFKSSFTVLSLPAKILLITGLVVATALFLERPIYNFVRYHQITPDCAKIMSAERCQVNYITARNLKLMEQKPANFQPELLPNYLVDFWLPGMIEGQITFLENVPPLPMIDVLYYSFAFVGAAVIIGYLHVFWKNKMYRFLLVSMAGYLVILIAYQYSQYVKFASPVALIGRYLIEVMPIFMIFVALAIRKLLDGHKVTLMASMLVLILLFTQGGGFTSYLLSPNTNLYWPRSKVMRIDGFLKRRGQQLIIHECQIQNVNRYCMMIDTIYPTKVTKSVMVL